MTWVIFSALAFCVFQIVFADKLAEDISASIDTSTIPMEAGNSQAYADIFDVADTAQIGEITSEEIYNKCTSDDAGKKFNDRYETKKDKCQQCYDKAKNTKDIQTAEKCCKKIAKELKEDVKVFKAQAKICIADLAKKCAKSSTVCRKEAANGEKAYNELMKKMGEKDAQRFRNSQK